MKSLWLVPLAVGAFVVAGCTASTGGSVVDAQTVHAVSTVTATATVTNVATVHERPTVERTIATRIRTQTVTYTPPPPHQFRAGTYLVGSEIKPGLYKSAGSSDCYWARLSGLGGSDNDIITNHIGPGQTIVQIEPTDKAFEVDGSCSFGRA